MDGEDTIRGIFSSYQYGLDSDGAKGPEETEGSIEGVEEGLPPLVLHLVLLASGHLWHQT